VTWARAKAPAKPIKAAITAIRRGFAIPWKSGASAPRERGKNGRGFSPGTPGLKAISRVRRSAALKGPLFHDGAIGGRGRKGFLTAATVVDPLISPPR